MATSHTYAVQSRALTRTRTLCVTVFRRALSTVILPVVMTATTIMASLEHGPVRVYWSIGIAAAVLINGVISFAKDRNAVTVREQAIGLRTALATGLNDTGGPLIAAVGRVAAAGKPESARAAMEALADRAVSLAQKGLGSQAECKTRATLYLFEGSKLVRKYYACWSGAHAPRQEWVRGHSDHDDEVIKFAYGEDALLVEDLENKPPPHFIDAAGRCYKSFVSVPVRAGDKSFGLLTADADCAYALNDVDRGFLILIAEAVGAGLAHVEVVEAQGPGSGPALGG
jgi:hypothetical protein